MKINRPLIRIEEHVLNDSNEYVKVIARAAFDSKQDWFGFSNEELNNLDLLELVAKGVERLDLNRRVKRAYEGLSNFFRDKIKGSYEGFRNYNRRSIKRLNETITANFGE